MMYFLLNEAKEPQKPKNHRVVFLDVFFPLNPGRLTWNIIMEVWFRSFSYLNGVICSFQPLIFQGVSHR